MIHGCFNLVESLYFEKTRTTVHTIETKRQTFMSSKPPYIERFHHLIDDDYEARACKDIADDACKVVPGNALLLTISLVLSKAADTFASAKIVLPWLMTSTGAPLFLVSLLVPIREAGSMLPQLLLGAYVRLKPRRKGFLILGAVLQALMTAGLLVAAYAFDGLAAGIAIVGLTVCFSLSRAISSIANKDLTGKTIPKSQRGQVSGRAASIAGFISIGFGLLLMFGMSAGDGIDYLLIAAALCFGLSTLSYGLIQEYPGATEGGVNAVEVAISNLRLLKDDRDFGRFVLVRALMISSGLVAPYFVLMAQAQQGSSLEHLGLLIIISGVASFISGNIWGRLADKNSKALMTLTAALNALICIAGAFSAQFFESNIYLYLGLFFVLSVVHEGVRQGRKTYLVDMAGGSKRTDYVSVSNTLIGVVLLIIGVLSGVIAQFSVVAVMTLFASFSLMAALLSLGMKHVSD